MKSIATTASNTTLHFPDVQDLMELAASNYGEDGTQMLTPHLEKLALLKDDADTDEWLFSEFAFLSLIYFMICISEWANLRDCYLCMSPNGDFAVAWGDMLTRRVEIRFYPTGTIGCVRSNYDPSNFLMESSHVTDIDEVWEIVGSDGMLDLVAEPDVT